MGEYLGQIKSYAEALEVMDDEHDDTLLANCMDVHSIKEIKEKDIKINYWIMNQRSINFLGLD